MVVTAVVRVALLIVVECRIAILKCILGKGCGRGANGSGAVMVVVVVVA